jgi:hypothetical protein
MKQTAEYNFLTRFDGNKKATNKLLLVAFNFYLVGLFVSYES